MEGILGYPSLPRQQLLALDPNIYGGEPFRHGLTPPQLTNEQLHSYGKTRQLKAQFIQKGKTRTDCVSANYTDVRGTTKHTVTITFFIRFPQTAHAT